MNAVIHVLLISNTLFELAVAIGSLIGGLTTTPVGVTQLVLGGNALALSLLSLLTLLATDAPDWRRGIQVFTLFHWSITAVWLIAAAGGSFNPALIAHGLFALAFTAALLRRAA